MSVAFYRRPSEMVGLTVGQLIPPLSHGHVQHRSWCTVLHPQELEACSQTGKFDESMRFDFEMHDFLKPIFTFFKQTKVLKKPEEKVLSLDYRRWAALFRRAVLDLHLGALGPPTLYMLRHAGASLDVARGARTLQEVQKRGRWDSFASVRRYEKAGRVAELLGRLPGSVQHLACRCSLKIGEILFGQVRL